MRKLAAFRKHRQKLAGVVICSSLIVVALSSCGASPGDRPTQRPAKTQATADRAKHGQQWTTFNFDASNSRYNRYEKKLSAANVAQLKEIWELKMDNGVTSTPIVVDGVVYVCDHARKITAVRATTGEIIWQRELKDMLIRCGTPLVVGDRVYFAGRGTVFAHNRHTGEAIWSTVIGTHEDTLIDSSPVVAGNKLVIGLANYEVIFPGWGSKDPKPRDYTGRGAIVALNMQDGKEVWRLWTGLNNEEGGAGVSVWSSAAVDKKRKLIFIGTGQAYEPPAGPYSDALIAINYETGPVNGKPYWVNQFYKGDVYTDGLCLAGRENCKDLDIGASPNLFVSQGKDVVGVASKGGLWRTVLRDTGATLWEVQLGIGSPLGGAMSVAAVGENAIYVASGPATKAFTYALNIQNGTILWQKKMEAPTWGALTLANGVLYQSLRNGYLLALDVNNEGQELWRGDLGHDAAGGVSVVDGVVYAPSGFTGLGKPARTGAALRAFALQGGTLQASQDKPAAETVLRPGSFSAAFDALSRNGCADSFCHGNAAGLNFSTRERAYELLVGADGKGVNAQGDACRQPGRKRVVPNDPQNSLLYQKIIQDTPSCGIAMPPRGGNYPVLSAADAELISKWIAAGARKD